MLSERTMEAYADAIEERMREATGTFIRVIASRMDRINAMTPTDLQRIDRMQLYGHDLNVIYRDIARISGKTIEQVREAYQTAAQAAWTDVQPLFDFRHILKSESDKFTAMQRYINANLAQTVQYVQSMVGVAPGTNLSNSMGFMMRDPDNPKRLTITSLAQTYQMVIDRAIQAKTMGFMGYDQAIRTAINDLVDSGIRSVTFTTESGRKITHRIEVAVRRNVLDGMRAVHQGIQDEAGKEFGADGKEISVHESPAPDHAPMQGHQFSLDEWENLQSENGSVDVNKVTFGPIKRKIGIWNCHHLARPIIIGVSKPIYSPEALKEILERNNKGFVDREGAFGNEGKKYTIYEGTQIQRALELAVRKEKEKQIMLRAVNDDVGAMEAQRKINSLTAKYKKLGEISGLPTERDKKRMAWKGYHKIKVD